MPLFALWLAKAPKVKNAILKNLAKTGERAGIKGSTKPTFDRVLQNSLEIVQWLLSFVGIIFFLLIIYAGFLWMTARENSTQVEKAKKLLKHSLIGLLIVLSSYSLSYFIVSLLTS